MQGILRKAALWLLGWLQGRVEPELSEQVEKAREQARRLEATNAAARRDIVKLEDEFEFLKRRRDELHGEMALLELEIEQRVGNSA